MPRSSYDFSVCDFLYDFLDTVGDRGLRRMCLQFIRAPCDFLICHLSTFSYKNARRSYGSRMSPQIVRIYRTEPVRCPYEVPIRFDKKTKGGRTVVVGSPQTVSGYRTESLGLLTDASVTFGLRLACDDRTMPFFAFSCGPRRVTRCSYHSTTSYDFRSLYDLVIVCTITNFKIVRP